MRIFSTFTGIGGFEVGIRNAWDKSVKEQFIKYGAKKHTMDLVADEPDFAGYSEIDKFAISVYEKHFEGVKNYGDITKINAEELPDFDCLVGGFPCQAFSTAGKRRGFADTRGTLFFDLARVLRAKQPRLFVFENVKGLLSHDGGNTFRTVISTITELGYDAQWQVLNSKDFGVPQNRERIIIVGHLRGSARPEVFPLERSNGNNIKEITRSVPQTQRVYSKAGVAPSIDTGLGGNRQPKIFDDYNSKWRSDELTCSLTTNTGSKAARNGQKIDDGLRIRRLTPLECERLQAFPDDWTKYGRNNEMVSDTQRYKMCGNAVTTNVIQAVFEKILAKEVDSFNDQSFFSPITQRKKSKE